MKPYSLRLSRPASLNLISYAFNLNSSLPTHRFLDMLARRPAPPLDTPPSLPTQDRADPSYNPIYERIPQTYHLSDSHSAKLLASKIAHLYENINQPIPHTSELISIYLEAIGLGIIPMPFDDTPLTPQELEPLIPSTLVDPTPTTPPLGLRKAGNYLLTDDAYEYLIQKAALGRYLHVYVKHYEDKATRISKRREVHHRLAVPIPTTQIMTQLPRGLSNFIMDLSSSTFIDTRSSLTINTPPDDPDHPYPNWTPEHIIGIPRRYRCLSLTKDAITSLANLALKHGIFEISEGRRLETSSATNKPPRPAYISLVYKGRYAANALEAIGLGLLTPTPTWPTTSLRHYQSLKHHAQTYEGRLF